MDTQRYIALAVFFVSGFLLWDSWQKFQHKELVRQAQTQSGSVNAVPSPGASIAPNADKSTAAPTPGQAPPASALPAGQGGSSGLPSGSRVRVQTDVLQAEIDTQGGDVRSLELLHHKAVDDISKPLSLLQDHGSPLYVVQSGLIGPGLPNHTTPFVAENTQYTLAPGADTVSVKLTADGGGAHVEKIYTFHRGSYVIDVAFNVQNGGSTTLQPYAYYQFLREGTPPPGDPRFISFYTGPAVYTEQDKLTKVSFPDIDKGKNNFPQNADNGWLGILQHYFVAAWIPKAGLKREFFLKKTTDKLYSTGVIVPVGSVPAGKSATIDVPFYAGPQEGERLRSVAPGLDKSIDFGWLHIIAVPLFSLLTMIEKLVGNWGLAIILLTVLIKLVFFPLSAASYKSMAKMRVVTPKLQRLREQYGDDRQKLHEAMMELYRTEKINPLGGCLPVVVQIPVFISLYWVLLAAVELRHAPFFGWIHDLSAQDPYYILPVIMGISMLVQTKLNPTPPDPVQAKVMMIMPFAFSIFFFFFPAGLVLYWVVNNVLSIAQQWQITRMIEGDAAKKRIRR